MHRFLIPSQNINQDKIVIQEKSELHHIKDVLRLGVGDAVIVFDTEGNEYKAEIENISRQNITLALREKFTLGSLAKIKITVACAIPKKSKMDDIIDKLTQLGVDRIIPLKTVRVIIKLDKDKENLRRIRWQKIALNASKQSQRSTVPVIEPIKDLKEILEESENFDLKLIPNLVHKGKTLKQVLTGSNPKNVIILIGPEGDFTEQEVNAAQNCGFKAVTLGKAVLRVDTAAIAVAAFIRFYEDN